MEHFYPGIASEHPENDWICIEEYLDRMHPGWRGQIKVEDSESRKPKRKVRNNFRLY